MRAMVLKGFGGTEVLMLREVPEPDIKPGEVLVKVKAIGIDRIDLKTRKGEGMAARLREEDPMILGWDMAGVVERTGEGVTDFRPGDAVFGTVNFPGHGNTYAEYVAAPASQLALKPANISFEEAAGATQSPLTAWQALVDTGRIRKGDKVLIHGASGGVGSFAVQIAKHLGAYVIGTASGPHRGFVADLGADQFIDYRTQRFEKLVCEVDFVLDPIGGDTFVRSLRVLGKQGMVVLLPSDRRAEAEKAAGKKYASRFRHILMHSDGPEMERIAALLADRSLKAYISMTFPFEALPEAHRALEAGRHTGKIVVTV